MDELTNMLSSKLDISEKQIKIEKPEIINNKTVKTTIAFYQKINESILCNKDKRIILLRIPEVIMWLFADLSFLPMIEHKNKTQDTKKLKILEDKWGQSTLKIRRPDLKLDKQWTKNFGEHISEEINYLLGKIVTKPIKKNHYVPDLEVDDAIIEVKTQTYKTTGTAGEKILGCPFKYAEIPRLYNKKLIIICIGGAEKACREEYGNLEGNKCSTEKNEFLEFFKSKKIEYIGITDIIRNITS